MDLTKLDRITLIGMVKEILLKDVGIYKDALNEILVEEPAQMQNEELIQLDKQIDEIFDEYDSVFKALA